MTLFDLFLHSNVIKMPSTFASGAGFYLLVKKYPYIFDIVGYLLTLGIFISFLFNIGEVYLYSIFYKRAFFFFGDGITTILVLFFSYAVTSGKKMLSIVTAGSIFMSGGKISLALLLLMILILVFINKGNGRHIFFNFSRYILFGLLIYGVMLCLSGIARHANLTKLDEGAPVPGHGACRTLSNCFKTQVKESLLRRYYSSLGGLWMTLEGGFRGPLYSSHEAFADLMIEKDPWGMNDKYKLTWVDWKKMGSPHNPYLRFGSRYGPWLLCSLALVFLSIGCLALTNLSAGEAGPATVFSLFFIKYSLQSDSALAQRRQPDPCCARLLRISHPHGLVVEPISLALIVPSDGYSLGRDVRLCFPAITAMGQIPRFFPGAKDYKRVLPNVLLLHSIFTA